MKERKAVLNKREDLIIHVYKSSESIGSLHNLSIPYIW